MYYSRKKQENTLKFLILFIEEYKMNYSIISSYALWNMSGQVDCLEGETPIRGLAANSTLGGKKWPATLKIL